MKFFVLSFLFLGVLVCSSSCFSWTITNEFLFSGFYFIFIFFFHFISPTNNTNTISGKGTVREFVLQESQGSFCFLVEVCFLPLSFSSFSFFLFFFFSFFPSTFHFLFPSTSHFLLSPLSPLSPHIGLFSLSLSLSLPLPSFSPHFSSQKKGGDYHESDQICRIELGNNDGFRYWEVIKQR